MNYYSDVFTPETWQRFVATGATITAFSAGMRSRAKQVQQGDRFICYLKGKFRWVGALEALSQAYDGTGEIWETDRFPVWVDVKPVVVLPVDLGVPLTAVEGRASFFKAGQLLSSVPSYFQGSPRRLSAEDGELVWRALLAADDGVSIGPVTEEAIVPLEEQVSAASEHTEMQLRLANFGLKTGCSVWIPRSDRHALVRADPDFAADLLLAELPMVFGGKAQGTVQNIDVLWLKGSTVIAAFEIEHSTAVYSGLLRMSDLVAEFPNVAFPLYVVAPDSRRDRVGAEVMRPTFRALPRPLETVTSFISYEGVRSLSERFPGEALRYVNADIVQTVAESFHAND